MEARKYFISTLLAIVIVGLIALGGVMAWQRDTGTQSSGSSVSKYNVAYSPKSVTDFLMGAGQGLASTRGDGSTRMFIYSQGLSFIEETRQVDILKGRNSVVMPDMPRGIDVSSIFVKDKSNTVRFLREIFRPSVTNNPNFFDLLNGQEISVKNFTDQGDNEVSGILLGQNNGYVINTKDGIRILNRADSIAVSGNDNYSALPGLVLDVDSPKSDKYNLTTSYLASDFSWQANYVGELSGGKLNLTGWANIVNSSGQQFANAKVTLVAGELNVQRQTPGPMYRKSMDLGISPEMAPAPAADFVSSPEKAFEYHLYNLKEPISIDSSPAQNIAFIYKPDVTVEQRYVFENGWREFRPLSLNLKLKNEESVGLGLTLPAGTMRLYTEGPEGTFFIGESYIPQFSSGDEKEIMIGQAMDVIGKKLVTESQSKPGIPAIKNACTQNTVAITISNKSDSDKTIIIKENLPSQEARILKISQKEYTRVDAGRIEVPLLVAKGSEGVLEYTVEWCY